MSAASPVTKTTHEQQLMRLVRKRKLLRARDVAEQGLPTITLTRLVRADKLVRMARGLYAYPVQPRASTARLPKSPSGYRRV